MAYGMSLLLQCMHGRRHGLACRGDAQPGRDGAHSMWTSLRLCMKLSPSRICTRICRIRSGDRRLGLPLSKTRSQ